MNNFAVAIIVGSGLSVYVPSHAADSIKTGAMKSATSPSTTSSYRTSPPMQATSTPSSATAKASTQNIVAGDPGAPTTRSKHHKKVAHKHKKNQLIGDGEPLSDIGKHKNVDGGFDFDNSKNSVK
jgi:hypothetical protein